jgi:hypothetical protein
MNKLTKFVAVLGIVLCPVAGANAQGWYNYTAPSLDSSAQPARPVANSYNSVYLGPGGEFYSGSVHTYSTNLGDGMSMQWFTTVMSGPSGGLPWSAQSGFGPGFSTAIPTANVNSLYSGSGIGTVASTGGRLSMDLGGGLSMDFLGAMSRAPGYFGPGYGFDSRMSTTVGTGFTMNFGHGGSLSIIGTVSRGFGSGYAACGPIMGACR